MQFFSHLAERCNDSNNGFLMFSNIGLVQLWPKSASHNVLYLPSDIISCLVFNWLVALLIIAFVSNNLNTGEESYSRHGIIT